VRFQPLAFRPVQLNARLATGLSCPPWMDEGGFVVIWGWMRTGLLYAVDGSGALMDGRGRVSLAAK
jgi:hypothetical protein